MCVYKLSLAFNNWDATIKYSLYNYALVNFAFD